MKANDSIMAHEAEKYKSAAQVREKAEAILDQKTGMLRDRPVFQVTVDQRFHRLNKKLHSLGWLGLVKTLKRKSDGFYAQLKLVDPSSEEAKEV